MDYLSRLKNFHKGRVGTAKTDKSQHATSEPPAYIQRCPTCDGTHWGPTAPPPDAAGDVATPAADRGEQTVDDECSDTDRDGELDTLGVVVESGRQCDTVETVAPHDPGDHAADRCEQVTGESHTGETTPGDSHEPDAAASHTGEARPPEGTLLLRILEFIERSDRPKRPWQVQKELRLARLPSSELSRLTSMGCLTRVKEGTYGVPGRHYGASVSAEGHNS